ncbi:transcriptional regulator, LuxR family [Beutenbergia cavernae DSM 12333]|uniref:Transcriptional regulator, LuxR family n=1 Tax=Beutenbergia cavernae (strain ATCC BAA-8 / DSM 12333 / CCUG 43141 / JCM 11478 / NBRC 16432 / NCIMB 13614 / HKI 0122) TaxID=471853 RepID=C5C1K1_BEUC1|nr:LuxR family transcriptional regulator [Beutenbergia cavernae]ACQ81611.1 transcriptional regulator, LuxR family [Beutenbergia cavernae DSM 12333]
MTGSGAVTGPQLLERERELAVLAAVVDRARQGEGGVVLITGEAGVGKTSLVRRFLADADGVRSRVGLAEDLVAARTLGPLREMFPDVRDLHEPGAALAAVEAEARAGPGPLALVVDDAHLADAATFEVLRSLGRRAETLPLVLVLAYRPDEVGADHPMRRALGVLVGAHVHRLELHGLSEGAVAALAERSGLDPARLAGLGGNPFYLTEVLAAPDSDLPGAVRDAIVGRVHGLPAPTRDLLEMLALVPRDADLGLFDGLAADVTASLERAERSGLVRVTEGRVAFRHDIARRALEASLPQSRRVHLHRRILGAFEDRRADPAVLLHHAVLASEDDAVARHAPEAARSAAHGDAHREAVTICGLALRRPDLLTHAEQAELHGIAARALYAAGRLPDAARSANRAVAIWERRDPSDPQYGAALLTSARMQTMVARPDSSLAQVRRALEVLEPAGASPLLATAHEMLANLQSIAGDSESAMGSAERARAMAVDLGERLIAARSDMHLGIALAGLGEDAEALSTLRRSVETLALLDAPEPYARATGAMAVTLVWWGRVAEALEWLDLTDRVASEHGFDLLRLHGVAIRAHAHTLQGRWDAAEAALRPLLQVDLGAAINPLPLAFLGRILLRRGDADGDRLVDEAWPLALATGQVRRIAPVAAIRTERAWLRRDPGAVRSLGEHALDVAAQGHLRYLGGEVLRYLRRAGDDVEVFPGCPEGFAAGIRGDHAASAAAWEEAGNPYECALELAESDDPAIAGRGVTILDRLGARATADRVRQDLRVRGVGPVPRRSAPARATTALGLTPRQHEILGLVARGLTSPEIADCLYLSRRTVDNHVADVLAALGVPSRRDAVATFRRHEQSARTLGSAEPGSE